MIVSLISLIVAALTALLLVSTLIASHRPYLWCVPFTPENMVPGVFLKRVVQSPARVTSETFRLFKTDSGGTRELLRTKENDRCPQVIYPFNPNDTYVFDWIEARDFQTIMTSLSSNESLLLDVSITYEWCASPFGSLVTPYRYHSEWPLSDNRQQWLFGASEAI